MPRRSEKQQERPAMKPLILTLILLALTACGGERPMNHPCFIYDTCRDDQTTVAASSSAAGYAPADVLTLNEAVGWRPAYASAVWQTGQITSLPSASHDGGYETNSIIVWGNWAILICSEGKAWRLDLTNPTGAWDDAGITDPPGGFISPLASVAVVGNYLYGVVNSMAPTGATFRLNLNSMTGAWDDAGVTDLPTGGMWSITGSGNYLYARIISGQVYRLNVGTNPAGAWEQLSTCSYGSSVGGKLLVINNYLYHFAGTENGLVSEVLGVRRLNLATPQGAWEQVSGPPTGEARDMALALADNRVYAAGGFRVGVGGAIGFQRSVSGFSPLNTDQWVSGYPQLPVAVSSAMAFVYSGKLYVIGGWLNTSHSSANLAGYTLDLSGEYVTIDYGQTREFNSIAMQARGMASGVVEFWGSSDNFSASSVFLGAAGGNGETGYVHQDASMIYRYLRVRCFGYDSDFLLRNVTAGLCPLLPYMADGSLLEGMQCEGKQLITQEKLHLGSARTATLRLLNPDWGQLLDEEKEAFDRWARACVATLSPCYFVPDTDSGTVYFCWTDPKYKYDPTMKKGLWELGKISLTARG